MQLLQTLSWAYKDGDFYENCCKLVKSVKNITKNAQFVLKVILGPLMDLKQNHYGSWEYYKRFYF